MLKLLAVFCLVAFAYCGGPPGSDSVDNSGAPPDPAGPPGSESVDNSGSGDKLPSAPDDAPPFPVEEKAQKIVAPPMPVWIPEAEGTEPGFTTIDMYSECNDPSLYENKDDLLEVDMESEYVCAFVAFQAHASTKAPYADQTEANERYALFKSCVDLVNEINSGQKSWTAEVNYFCDYSEADKAMSRGLYQGAIRLSDGATSFFEDTNTLYEALKGLSDGATRLSGPYYTWLSYEVNYFCDYSEADKAMSRGLIIPDDQVRPDNNVAGGRGGFLG